MRTSGLSMRPCCAASCNNEDTAFLDPKHLVKEAGYTPHDQAITFKCATPDYTGSIAYMCNDGTFGSPQGTCTGELDGLCWAVPEACCQPHKHMPGACLHVLCWTREGRWCQVEDMGCQSLSACGHAWYCPCVLHPYNPIIPC